MPANKSVLMQVAEDNFTPHIHLPYHCYATMDITDQVKEDYKRALMTAWEAEVDGWIKYCAEREDKNGHDWLSRSERVTAFVFFKAGFDAAYARGVIRPTDTGAEIENQWESSKRAKS